MGDVAEEREQDVGGLTLDEAAETLARQARAVATTSTPPAAVPTLSDEQAKAIPPEATLYAIAKAVAESGYYPDVRTQAQAVTRAMLGRELGILPVLAQNAIYLIDGKPALSYPVIAFLVRKSKRYDFRVRVLTRDRCEIEFFMLHDGGARESLGVADWTMEDAKLAGLAGKHNWRNYPRDMLRARCLTFGVRTYCPDVLFGTGAYVPEELGIEVVDPETGEIIGGQPLFTEEARPTGPVPTAAFEDDIQEGEVAELPSLLGDD